jgi:hypothetical protein
VYRAIRKAKSKSLEQPGIEELIDTSRHHGERLSADRPKFVWNCRSAVRETCATPAGHVNGDLQRGCTTKVSEVIVFFRLASEDDDVVCSFLFNGAWWSCGGDVVS